LRVAAVGLPAEVDRIRVVPGADIPLPPRRSVQQIDPGREAAKNKCLEAERQYRAAQEAKRQAERKQQLEKLVAMSDQAWAAIDKPKKSS